MNEEDLAPHVVEIKQALGGEITESQIRDELNKYLELGILLSEAKRAIVKNFGGSTQRPDRPIERKLDTVASADSNIEIVCKIISANEKEVNVQGGKKTIMYGLMADDTMARPFTSWNYLELKKDDIIRVRGAYVKEFRGELQINFGNNTVVEHLDGTTFEAVDFNEIKTEQEFKEYKIGDMDSTTKNIVLTARVIEIGSREITARGEQKMIYTGSLGDETGTIAFTAWNDFSLQKGEIIKVTGGYIRTWRGINQLNFDDSAQVERVSDVDLPDAEELNKVDTVQIYDVENQMNIQKARCEGTVINIRPGSGLIFRCPECNKILRDSSCLVHGEQEGKPDLRIKAILDDGTGTVTVMMNRDQTETLMDNKLDHYVQRAKDAMDSEVVFGDVEQKVLDLNLGVVGAIRRDDFGPTIFVDTCEMLEPDSKEMAKKALEELEEW